MVIGGRGLWLRWSWRDLRARWLQVAAIALVIALGSGTYTGLGSSAAWRRTSYPASYEASASHDLLVTFAEGTTADQLAVEDALTGSDWEFTIRLTTRIQVDASTDGQTILVPGRMVGLDLRDDGPRVDRLTVTAGEPLGPSSTGSGAVLMDQHFIDANDLPPTGTIRLGGDRTLSYQGTALHPQYFVVLGDQLSLVGDAGFAVVYAPLEDTQEVAGQPGRINEIGVRLPPGADRETAAVTLEAVLTDALPDTAFAITPLDEQRVYRMLYDDIEGDQKLFNIFAVIILAGAAFAAFNLTGRIVEAQRREIGIGMSLGVPTGAIATRPLLVGLQVSLLGVALGVVVGFLISSLMADLITSFFPLPVWETDFQPAVFARGALLGLVLTFGATVWPVVRAVRVPPIEAIHTGPRRSDGGGLAHQMSRLPLPGGSVAQMPLRNILRAPRRTLLTALGIAAAIATLIGVIGMVDSFLATIDRGEDEILRQTPDRVIVDLATFLPTESEAVTDLLAFPGVAEAEAGLRVGGSIATDGEDFEVFTELVDFDSPIWAPTIIDGVDGVDGVDGADKADEPALVLSRKAASDLGVTPGDRVTFRHPVREGLGYRWEETSVLVGGLHPNPYRFETYLDDSAASLFGLEGITNTVQMAPEPGTDPDELKRALFGQPGVGSVQPVSVVITTIRDTISEFLDILLIVQWAVLLLALLIAFNSSSISSDERRREHATMFAYGVTPRRVLGISVIESAVTGVIATVVGIGLGLTLLGWMSRFLLPTTMPELGVDIDVATTTYVTAFAMGVVAVALAPVLTYRKLRRMDIPSTLRVVE